VPVIPRYCPACGAANPAESLMCLACQLPLDAREEKEQEVLLHGRYRLLTQVGAGGFGGVYRALDTAEAGRIVAVKEINLHGLSAQEVIEATDGFYREVRLLSTLRHPNLPVIHDTFTDPEHWYLVMDFLEGETLEAYLKRKPRPGLPLEEALAIGIQLCTVLDYLHTREPAIIFRDLKPSNVMRTASGQLYLIDFGIARHFSPGKLKDTAPFGSPGYAAPEQYGRAQTTPQADIYSLGALLHHLVTGNDPAENPFRFAPLPIAASTELAELDTLIQRMVAMETGERLASSAEVKTTLQRLAETIRRREYRARRDNAPPIPGPAPVPTPSTGITRRGLLTTGLKIGGVAVGVVGVVGLCGLYTRSIHFGIGGVVVRPPPSPGVAKKQLVYHGHTGAITALSWSPDGTMVASGSSDKTVQVWRAADGALLYTLSGYDRPVTSVVWATDRTNVIASAGMSDGTVQVWDALRDHRDRIFHGGGRVLALSWKEKSPWIVSGGTDREIYTWNASSGKKGVRYTGHKGEVKTVAWLPDMPGSATPGSVAPESKIASGGADTTVQVWNAATGENLLTCYGHTAGVNGLALLRYDPNGPVESVVSASDDGTARVWSPISVTQTVAAQMIYRGHRGKVNAVATVPSINAFGQRVATASDDQTVQVWSLGAYIPTTIYKEHHAPVKALAASPVDNRMVSGDAAGLIHLWTISDPSYR
jgi:eukaryotic-like serine/threonine-protein kinase